MRFGVKRLFDSCPIDRAALFFDVFDVVGVDHERQRHFSGADQSGRERSARADLRLLLRQLADEIFAFFLAIQVDHGGDYHVVVAIGAELAFPFRVQQIEGATWGQTSTS
jgi:hypothetical protein